MPTTTALEVDALARFFRVLGDPTRLRIIEALLDGDKTVSELMESADASQSRVSNHLACLRWCRVVETERRGRNVVYRLIDPEVRRLLATASRAIRDTCDHLAGCKRIGPDWVG